MNDSLEVRTAHNLMCVGLYTVCFEAMVLLWRQKLYAYLANHEAESLPKLTGASRTAEKTFSFCAPYLLEGGVVEQSDLDRLNEIRRKRNVFAHEGYSAIWSVHFSDISDDLEFVDKLAFKVSNWRFPMPVTSPPLKVGDSVKVGISPRMFTNFIRALAGQVAHGLLHYEFDEQEIELRAASKGAEQSSEFETDDPPK